MTDTERLDWIEANEYDLKCIGITDSGGVYWDVISHHMAKPYERNIGIGGNSPREAIDRAIAEEKNK